MHQVTAVIETLGMLPVRGLAAFRAMASCTGAAFMSGVFEERRGPKPNKRHAQHGCKGLVESLFRLANASVNSA